MIVLVLFILVFLTGYSQDVKYTTFYDSVGRYILLYKVNFGQYRLAYVCDTKIDTIFTADLSVYKAFKVSLTRYRWERIAYLAQVNYVRANKCFGSRLKELN